MEDPEAALLLAIAAEEEADAWDEASLLTTLGGAMVELLLLTEAELTVESSM